MKAGFVNEQETSKLGKHFQMISFEKRLRYLDADFGHRVKSLICLPHLAAYRQMRGIARKPRSVHVQIESEAEIAFAAYDKFSPASGCQRYGFSLHPR